MAECAFGSKVFPWTMYVSLDRGDIHRESASPVLRIKFEPATRGHDDRARCNKFSPFRRDRSSVSIDPDRIRSLDLSSSHQISSPSSAPRARGALSFNICLIRFSAKLGQRRIPTVSGSLTTGFNYSSPCFGEKIYFSGRYPGDISRKRV